MIKTFDITHITDTEKAAADLAAEVIKRRFVCLYGGLGAGKTTFTGMLVKGIIPECQNLVHSPTFAIVNEYLGRNESIFHFDLYRIKDEDDLYSTGFYDYADRNGIIVVEWPEAFESSMPENALRIRITQSEGRRNLEAEGI